jgi:hypothetical protein
VSAFVINSYAFGGEDADAKAYLDAVESADTQALEAGVRKAVDDFVKGCKADAIWSAIESSCILMGARTLIGALTALKGTAPTNESNNFVSGDYNRKTGLVGNGSNKSLNTNKNNNSYGQNDFHMAVYVYTTSTATRCYIGGLGGAAGDSNIFDVNTAAQFRNRQPGATADQIANSNVAGFIGCSRGASASYVGRVNKTSSTLTRTSQSPSNTDLFVFRTNVGTGFYSAARIQFYSVGTNIDLSLLDSRLETLAADIDAAI